MRRLPSAIRFVKSRDGAVELQLVDRAKDLAHARSGLHAEIDQMPSEQNRRWRLVLDAKRSRAIEEPLDARAIEHAGATGAIRSRKADEQFEIDLLRQRETRRRSRCRASCKTPSAADVR
jgi:hypothetical protein